MHEMDEIIKEFLIESFEILDQLDQDLIELEERKTDAELIARIFRGVHTIKGTCGFLSYTKLEGVAHAGESLLSKVRDGVLGVTPEITTTLLAVLDAIRELLKQIETQGAEGDGDYSALIAKLKRLQEGKSLAEEASTPAPATTKVATPAASELAVVADTPVAEAPAEAPPVPVQTETPTPKPKAAVKPSKKAETNDTRGRSVADSTIRIDVSLLDNLMNLVGELVLTRNQIIQHSSKTNDPEFVSTTQHLNLITTELQESVMKTRLQPIGIIWNKFPRTVRDTALSCGKVARLVMEGEDTELDKTIIEAIKDPLTHIVRNSVDHGIETPKERIAAGKPAEGRLLLKAYHEGGQVNIEISDDGAGINTGKVLAKALERGLVTPERAERMTEREIVNLVFLPGFSTAQQVSNISGRGVGMDVVRTNIEKVGGVIDLISRAGEGTTMRIKIPLTLAIIPTLIVSTSGDRYAIPQVNLLELVRLDREEAVQQIEMVHKTPVYRLRGKLLPLVYLNKELQVEPKASEDGAVNIVVLHADDRTFGLVVDEINDTEEIVVKPLGKLLKNTSAYAGSTIMGDGRVALILDVMGMAQRAGIVTEDMLEAQDEEAETTVKREGDTHKLMLLGIGQNRQAAIPLETVARLEEFPADSVEFAGDQEVVQYRGHILPLVRLGNVLGAYDSYGGDGMVAENKNLNVVVCSSDGSSVGLVVDEIRDIVNESVVVHPQDRHDGVIGAGVVQGKVAEMLDVPRLIASSGVQLFVHDYELDEIGSDA